MIQNHSGIEVTISLSSTYKKPKLIQPSVHERSRAR